MRAKITSLHPQKSKANVCPLCGEKAVPTHTPFCSRRCSQLDLANWLKEVYVILGHQADEDADLEKLISQSDKDTSLS